MPVVPQPCIAPRLGTDLLLPLYFSVQVSHERKFECQCPRRSSCFCSQRAEQPFSSTQPLTVANTINSLGQVLSCPSALTLFTPM